MPTPSALRLALDLFCLPTQVRTLRDSPLPSDLLILLKIAAGEEEAIKQAVAASTQPPERIREAAAFFIEQILLFPGANSYRVLGATSDATTTELRRNMALLLRWLHPDVDRDNVRSIFTTRVTRAWNDLKTPDRQLAYDLSQSLVQAEKSLSRSKGKSRGSKGRSHRRPPNPQSEAKTPTQLLYGESPLTLLRRFWLSFLYRTALWR